MEERNKYFINSVIFTARIFPGLEDKFLAGKLYEKLSALLETCVAQRGFRNTNVAKSDHIVQHEGHVAQYSHPDLVLAVNNLLDLFDHIEHAKSTSTTPLLYARRNLLAFKLQLIKSSEKPAKIEKDVKEEKEPPLPAVKTYSKPKKEIATNSNKQKILNFIKRSPNSRTKDIIYEFSILSDRTVKRNLQELLQDGLIVKKSKDNAVYYQ